MRFFRLFGIFLIMVLLLSGCAGGSSTSLANGDGLKARCHMDLDFRQMAQDKFWATLIGLAGCAAFLAALFTLFSDDPNFWKWLLIMVAIFSWFALATAVAKGIENSWPSELTDGLIKQALGKEGIIPEGDISPWSAPFVDITVSLVSTILWLTHGFVGIWFLLLPIPWLVENIVLGRRFGFAAIGSWLGFFLARLVSPRVLLYVTQRIEADRVKASGLPIIGDAVAVAKNTLSQLNTRFILSWWLAVLLVFVAFVSAFAIIAFTMGPTAARVGLRVGREGKKLVDRVEREARKSQKEQEHLRDIARDTVATEAARSAAKGEPMPKDVYEQRLREATALVRGQSSTSSQSVSSSLAAPVDGNSAGSTGGGVGQQRFESGPGQQDRKDKHPVAKEAIDKAATAAQAAGPLVAVMGAPEVGVPLAVVGTAVQAAVRASENQDPDMAVRQSEADEALVGFKEEA